MITVDIDEARVRLADLVERAAQGEPFVIAKAGKPLVKVVAVASPETPQRLGFLAGEIAVPEDFDRLGEFFGVPPTDRP